MRIPTLDKSGLTGGTSAPRDGAVPTARSVRRSTLTMRERRRMKPSKPDLTDIGPIECFVDNLKVI